MKSANLCQVCAKSVPPTEQLSVSRQCQAQKFSQTALLKHSKSVHRYDEYMFRPSKGRTIIVRMHRRENLLAKGDWKKSGWGLHDKDRRQWNNGANGYREMRGS